MRLTRRTALAVGIGTIALGRPAFAQAWQPTRDVEFVIPFGVGGGADLMARVIQKIITDERLVPVAVNPVNRPGAQRELLHRRHHRPDGDHRLRTRRRCRIQHGEL